MSVCFAGTWVHEGHYVQFTIHENDTVSVAELLEKPYEPEIEPTTKIMSLDDAMEYQQSLIKFGYDDISGVVVLISEVNYE